VITLLNFYNTIDDINEKKTDTAIIPIGSVEQHGSHLPVGTDCFIITELSRRVAGKINAYLLPVLPISTCYEHKGRKGSVWMRPNTFYQMLQDIILCLNGQGFNKIIVMPGHGGIFVAAPAIRELNALHDNLQVIKVEFPTNEFSDKITECKDDIHAGEKETSCMLYLMEEYVKNDLAKQNDFIPDCPRDFLNYSSLLRLSKTGVWGKPSLASKEKGKKLFDNMEQAALGYIKKAFKHTTKQAW